jgi:hypothetical protein
MSGSNFPIADINSAEGCKLAWAWPFIQYNNNPKDENRIFFMILWFGVTLQPLFQEQRTLRYV